MHQVLDGRLIEVTTVVELSLGGRKGGSLIYNSFLQLFQDLGYLLLNREWRLTVLLLEPGIVE